MKDLTGLDGFWGSEGGVEGDPEHLNNESFHFTTFFCPVFEVYSVSPLSSPRLAKHTMATEQP